MSMFFHRFLTKGVAQLSYLVGDSSAGTAAVIDPQPDVDAYLDAAREEGVVITHAFETHIHADFMSGARELSARTGVTKIFVSEEGGAKYGFDHEAVHDGQEFEFGKVRLKAAFTPGHTPEHVSYQISENDKDRKPWGVFTGDSLFIDSVGRPDLLGDDQKGQLTRQLFDTMRDFYNRLDDDVIVMPCHGAGSACGPKIGDRTESTIGYEKKYNPYLQIDNFEDFKKKLEEEAPPEPPHYEYLKKVNSAGPTVLGNLPVVPALNPKEFLKRHRRGDCTLVDTRQMLAFGGGHVPGALNIGAQPELSVWAGWLLDHENPLLLVLEDERLLPRVLKLFMMTGFTNYEGYLAGGMEAWDNNAMPLEVIPQLTVHELKKDLDSLQVVDVRKPDEWEEGHIPGAVHRFLGGMRERIDGLDKAKPTATYCATGYRASLAASLMKKRGFKDVRSVPGSWTAWTNAGFPKER